MKIETHRWKISPKKRCTAREKEEVIPEKRELNKDTWREFENEGIFFYKGAWNLCQKWKSEHEQTLNISTCVFTKRTSRTAWITTNKHPSHRRTIRVISPVLQRLFPHFIGFYQIFIIVSTYYKRTWE